MIKLQSININEKTINYLIILYAFILPISRAGISLLTAILFLLWLLDANLKERAKSVLQNRAILAILAFCAFSTLSLVWSQNIPEGLHLLINYWYFLPILVFASYVKLDELTKIVSAFLLGMLISEVLSYGIFFELWSMKHGSPMDPTPFMNHLQYSMFLTFASLLLLNRFFFESKIKWKIFYFLYFLTVTSNLFLNGGRTGHLAFAISIFVVGLLNIKNKLVAFVSMLALVSAIFYTAYHVSPVFKVRFDESKRETAKISDDASNKYSGSFGIRLGAWILGGELFVEKPIIGTGIGSELDALREKLKTSPKEFQVVSIVLNTHFHNNYVTYAVQLGIIGLLLYLNIMYQTLKLPLQNRELSNLKYIFIVVYGVASLVEEMFAAQFSLALFALFVGIFISASKKERAV